VHASVCVSACLSVFVYASVCVCALFNIDTCVSMRKKSVVLQKNVSLCVYVHVCVNVFVYLYTVVRVRICEKKVFCVLQKKCVCVCALCV